MTEHTPWEPRRINDTDTAWAVIGLGPVGDTIIAGYIKNKETCRLIAAAPDMLAALENLLTYDRVERPAFRAKPEGAPGSAVRIQQDKLIALEDDARAAINKARSAK